MAISGRNHLVLDAETRTYKNIVVDIDFSVNALAAVLHQQDPVTNNLRFISAKTRKLAPYEKSYHSAKGKLLGLVFALEKF